MNQRVYIVSLLRREWLLQRRTWLVQAAATTGVALVLLLGWRFLSGEAPSSEPIQILFSAVLLFGGSILASMAFQEAHRPLSSPFFHLLPADATEKYLSRVVLYGLLFMLFASGGFVIISLLAAALSLLFGQEGFPLFNPFAAGNLQTIEEFLITMPIFLAGGVFFRKQAFLKTLLALIGFWLIFGILVAAVSAGAYRFMILPIESRMTGDYSLDFSLKYFPWGDQWRTILEYIGIILRRVVIPVYALIVGWMRLRESEVAYGV